MPTSSDLFDLAKFSHRGLFNENQYAWQALHDLKSYMASQSYPDLSDISQGTPLASTLILHQGRIIAGSEAKIEFGDATKGKLLVSLDQELLQGASVIMAGALLLGREIAIGTGTLIESGGFIQGPAIIGDNCAVRHGAYLRGHCLTGNGCVLGHTTEVKHSIFLDNAKAGHFAYVGDSILGNQVNLGAGTKLANLRFTSGNIQVKTKDETIETGLRKLGAILADHVQTGCNSVTSPGTIIGRKTMLLPNTTASSGLHRANSLIR